MKSPTKHLTPDEIRTLWILTAVLLLGIGGRIWIASHPGAAVQGNPPAAIPAAATH
ncbi:MAG: hypothetical protein ACKOKG_10145 [Verrucomicrobiota bacterium]|jgi:hypothetical protein